MNWAPLPGPQFCVWFVFKQFSFGGQIHKCELAYFWRFDFFPATLFSKSSLAYRYKKHTNLGKNDVFGCKNVPIVMKSKQTFWRRDSVSTYHISLIERWLWSFCLVLPISCQVPILMANWLYFKLTFMDKNSKMITWEKFPL